MPALTKTARDALPAEAFAVPGRRHLPIHDADHVRMAWAEVTGAQARLTDDERASARILVMKAAAELGVDTAPMHRIKGMQIQAMSLDVPEVEDHPNRHPFSGTLVRLDEPSDLAPHGSGNRKIQITRAAAEAALPSLLGMGVGITADLDGHDERNKVGVIMGAEIVDEADGPTVQISGFLYSSDFPAEVERIRASASDLGFSFEARDIYCTDPRATVVEVNKLSFTGAAILFKDKAAYHKTSLSAAADRDTFDMTSEEMKALLDGAVKAALEPIQAQLTAVQASADKLTAENQELLGKVNASRAILDRVEPFAVELETAATKMEAAGIGAADRYGYVAALKLMASSMRAEAARGTTPASFSSFYAAAVKEEAPAAPAKPEPVDHAKLIADAVAAEVTKIQAAADKAVEEAKGKLSAEQTKMTDVRLTAAAESPQPERKTMSPQIVALLAKASVDVSGDGKVELSKLDAALAASGLTADQRMQAKAALRQAGKID